jgi:hypothetical protein
MDSEHQADWRYLSTDSDNSDTALQRYRSVHLLTSELQPVHLHLQDLQC